MRRAEGAQMSTVLVVPEARLRAQWAAVLAAGTPLTRRSARLLRRRGVSLVRLGAGVSFHGLPRGAARRRRAKGRGGRRVLAAGTHPSPTHLPIPPSLSLSTSPFTAALGPAAAAQQGIRQG
jgi:hypothetical protein